MMKVISAGLKRGYEYGSTVRGTSSSQLLRYRQKIAKAAGKTRSASLAICPRPSFPTANGW